MKWLALVLALGLVEMMGVMFIAMAANASAHTILASGSRTVIADLRPADPQPANFITSKSQIDLEGLQGEAPRKNTRKRSRSRCARITTTCWSAA